MLREPVVNAAWRSGFWEMICSLRLVSRLTCSGMCDMVSVGSSGVRARALRPSSVFSSSAISLTFTSFLNLRIRFLFCLDIAVL